MVSHAIHARIIIFFMFFFLYIFCSSGAFPLPPSLVTASGERIHYVGFTFAFVFIYDDFLSAPVRLSYSEISHRFAIFIYKSDAEVTHAGTVYDSSMNDVLTTSQCDTLRHGIIRHHSPVS